MLAMNDITLTFNKNTALEKRVIKNLNLEINPGDFITVIGNNGAGKSTLLNLISGACLCDEGSIFIDQKNITRLNVESRARWITRIFQNPTEGTCAELSVEENMLLGVLRGKNKSLKKASSNLLRRRFQQLLSSLNMGLENQLAQPIGLLSGGQRQAINLLIATMEPSKILLLDEHTAALDPVAAKMVLTLTEQLVNQHQLTVLMITHNLTDALQYGNKIIMMQNGEIKRSVGKEEKRSLKMERLVEEFSN